jgi:hypothetical protein
VAFFTKIENYSKFCVEHKLNLNGHSDLERENKVGDLALSDLSYIIRL